jgi:hypothetical protein
VTEYVLLLKFNFVLNNNMILDNKYSKWYNSIIAQSQARGFESKTDAKQKLGYVEVHHIIPKSIGGSNNKSNLAYLTAREHFICHLLLPKMYTDSSYIRKMIFALNKMLQKSDNQYRIKITSRQYNNIRKEFSTAISEVRKGVSYGPLSDSHKIKLSNATKGVPKTEKARANMAIGREKVSVKWKSEGGHPAKGTIRNADQRKRQSNGSKENRKIKVMCEHCTVETDRQNYSRWHGMKCKNRITSE